MELSSLEKEQFIRSYREKRAFDLEITAKGKSVSGLSQEEKALIKILGIKQKDLALLKEML